MFLRRPPVTLLPQEQMGEWGEQGIVLMHSWGVVHALSMGRESVTPCVPKSDVRELGFCNRKFYKGQLFFSSV